MFTSHFVYFRLQDVPLVRRLRVNIDTKKSKKVHPLYLFLLTGQIPYTKKFYPSWKNSSTHSAIKPRALTNRVQVCVRPRNKFVIVSEILNHIIPKQIAHEKPIWHFQDEHLMVIVPMASLTKSTAYLQGKNSYFPNFALTLHFTLNNITAFQKLFFLRSFKIIQSSQKIKGLDFIES